jgi:hypothetical protein
MSTTLVGEDTDLLLLLLYYAEAINCTKIYFRSDMVKSNLLCYDIKVFEKILGEASVMIYRSFVHSP